MSNPTELPDLDRGYFKGKLGIIVRDLSSYTAQEMARELVRLAKVADENEALKEARCAQTEGEAPQAVAVARLLELAAEENADAGASIQHGASAVDVPEWAQLVVKLFAPAAQQAESGAQADALWKALTDLRELHISTLRTPTHFNAYLEIIDAALAAQSQGAQAARATNWNNVIDTIADELEAKSNLNEISQFTALCEEFDRRGDALAAKAEAPADPYALDDDDEVRFPNDTQVAIVSVKRYYELRGFEERAHQAAAPGALTDETLAGMLLGKHVTELGYRMLINGDQVEFSLQELLAIVNTASAAAPGTPQALADRHPVQPLVKDARGCTRFKRNAIVDHLATDKLNELATMDFPAADWEQLAQLIGYSLEGFGTLSYVTDETYDRAAAQPVLPRAAQLDGGQGEG